MHIYTYHCILSGASAQRAGSLRLYPFPCLMHSFLTSYTRAVGTQSWQPTHLPAPLPLRVPIALISDILHTCSWHSIVTAYTPTCTSTPARAYCTYFWHPTHLRLALNCDSLHTYLRLCPCPCILHALLKSYTFASCTQFSHPTHLPAPLLLPAYFALTSDILHTCVLHSILTPYIPTCVSTSACAQRSRARSASGCMIHSLIQFTTNT